jgi:RimJ/RimL family protein N-acetyltransferase
LIGDEWVSLSRCSKLDPRYLKIWHSIQSEPTYESWFGGRNAEKGQFTDTFASWIFALLTATLVADVFIDPTPWTPTNRFFVWTLGFLSVSGLLWSLSGRRRRWKHHSFLIKLGGKVIGVGDVYHDMPNGSCSLTAAILPNFRGRKLGSVATRAMIRSCFTDLEANRVESTALSSNPASLRMNDRMVEEGILRERYLVGETYVDVHCYRLLKTEWLNEVKKRDAGSRGAGRQLD